jgi:NodT family efflux transporter outer membrane factor (OMF) lipoprotein
MAIGNMSRGFGVEIRAILSKNLKQARDWTLNAKCLRRVSHHGAGLTALALVLASGCTVGPNYVRPSAEAPAAYKETPQNFKEAQPNDQIARGKWWEVYDDAQLNTLEDQVVVSNQSLKAEEAQFAAARAAVQIVRAQSFPTVTGGISGAHYSASPKRPLVGAVSNYQDYQLPVDVSYEPDLWGRVRRLVEANRSEAQATAADLANVQLSLQAELAVDYYQMRGLDAQKKLLDSTVESYQKALELTQTRYQGGVATAVDVAQAQTQLETTRALSIDVGVNRAAYEHAIAVLVGKPLRNSTLCRCHWTHLRRRRHRGFRRICWSGGRMWLQRNVECRKRTRRSAWRRAHIFRT